jgi:hypothetical protein
VHAHLVRVPRLRSLSARRLARGDLQLLGGQADRALDAQVLGLGAVDQLLADFLEGLDVYGCVRICGGRRVRGKVLLLVRVMRILWTLGPSPKSAMRVTFYSVTLRAGARCQTYPYRLFRRRPF